MRIIVLVLVIAIALAGAVWITQRHDEQVPPAPHHTQIARPRVVKSRPIAPAPVTPETPTPALPETPVPVSPSPAARVGEIPDDLIARQLTIPVSGVNSADLRDSFFDGRTGHMHEAIDIVAPRGQPVMAVEDGKIAKLFTSVPGGLTIYQFDPTETYTYYYAHLDHYADGLAQGGKVKRGQVIAYVGSTGDADPAHPHLHFSIFRLNAEKQWWKGDALDPYPALARR